MHYCFADDFDMGLVTLVLGVRKHRGAYRLRYSCFCELLSGRRDRDQGTEADSWTITSKPVTA